jgi:hypothetical protein
MTKPLVERLHTARAVLDQAHTAILRHSTKLSADASDGFLRLVELKASVPSWLGLLEARTLVFQTLVGLETLADAHGLVPFGVARAEYQHARFIGVASYLTTTWALADRITDLAGLVLCTPEAGRNVKEPCQLISHFVLRNQMKKRTAAALFESVRSSFGWPIGLSYALRNHFVHDGGRVADVDFFEGATPISGFRIAHDAWGRIERRAQEYDVTPEKSSGWRGLAACSERRSSRCANGV